MSLILKNDILGTFISMTVVASLAERLEGLPAADSPERQIAIIELSKEADVGIGLTIVGGENTSRLELGIFVKSVTPRGPAERSGQVHPGDRIIAINGQSLEGMPHHIAGELIRDSPAVVQLILSQSKVTLGHGCLTNDKI